MVENGEFVPRFRAPASTVPLTAQHVDACCGRISVLEGARMVAKRSKTPAEMQAAKFRDLARELGADEDEAAFKEKLVKVAKAPRSRKQKSD